MARLELTVNFYSIEIRLISACPEYFSQKSNFAERISLRNPVP